MSGGTFGGEGGTLYTMTTLFEVAGCCSLILRPLPFLFFGLHPVYNTQKQKRGEKWGRLGNTYHENDVRWTRGGHREEGSTLK